MFCEDAHGIGHSKFSSFSREAFKILQLMETESDSKLAFLDTAVSREPDGRLTTSVYWKPTHTDLVKKFAVETLTVKSCEQHLF